MCEICGIWAPGIDASDRRVPGTAFGAIRQWQVLHGFDVSSRAELAPAAAGADVRRRAGTPYRRARAPACSRAMSLPFIDVGDSHGSLGAYALPQLPLEVRLLRAHGDRRA